MPRNDPTPSASRPSASAAGPSSSLASRPNGAANQATTQVARPGTPSPARAEPTPEQIRVRAYEIYLARGAQPGREVEDWEQARRELTNLVATGASATAAGGRRA